jgi:Domain of unknown function (DUF4041)/Meiotically up-regulated gene 113
MNPDLEFNPPPGWPKPPSGWKPPKGWSPDPNWPAPPLGWELWVSRNEPSQATGELSSEPELDPTEHDGLTDKLTMDRLSYLEAENRELKRRLESMSVNVAECVVLSDEFVLQEVGIYRYHHPLESAAEYQERLAELDSEIAEFIRIGRAIEKSNMFTYDNSLAKGRKMADDLAKLMLRAYNAEAENCVRSLRVGNVVTAKGRIERSRVSIEKLGKMMEMKINLDFHALRVQEIEMTSDFLMKRQEEKELAREERAQLREEKKVAAELASQRELLEKERSHILNALEALRLKDGTNPALEEKLSELDAAIAQNDYRAANIRAGYVYIISNRGAFGPNVVKIGLTRRLEPLDRVIELGDASVPFHFDVHGLFFSEDAVTIETELHRYFADRKVNHVNLRKEFFFASPAEVREVLISKMGSLLEFNEHAEATDFHQSLKYWPEPQQTRARE